MKRHKHSLSHYRLVTCDMGKLVPVSCVEVLPGDTLQQATSALVRVSPLVAPVMHPVSVRVHHWFVPYRLVWSGWENFITGGPDGTSGSDPEAFPHYDIAGAAEGSLADYLGIPTGKNIEVSQLPFRAYQMIWNEFYRDQDLQAASIVDGDIELKPVCWEKDYFTSARPWPQKGPDVSLPLGVNAPVIANPSGGAPNGPYFRTAADATPRQLGVATPDEVTLMGYGSTPGQALEWADSRLVADLTNATAVNVNDVRLAFALQRYQEARSRYGSRYTEYLRYLGVRSSDARLQRPEYLGGGKQTIAFSEVLQTAPGEPDDSADVVGALKGHGISAMRSRRYRRFFEEHGVVLSLMSVRPRTMYADKCDRMWQRRVKEDFWQKELEQIGQQEILNREIYAEDTLPEQMGTFGYQDRYAEYKHQQSSIHGEFRSILNYWHLGRIFGAQPVLNDSFVTCDPSKRIHAEQTQHSLWCMVSNSIQARRMVSRNPSSRIM